MCLGAKGAIARTANIAPRLVSEIHNAYLAGDHARSPELQFRLAPLRAWIEKTAGDLTAAQRRDLQDMISNPFVEIASPTAG